MTKKEEPVTLARLRELAAAIAVRHDRDLPDALYDGPAASFLAAAWRFVQEHVTEREREQQRRKKWDDAIRAVRLDIDDHGGGDHTDDLESIAELREALVRTRLAAAVERQATRARTVVVDVEPVRWPNGKAVFRFLVSVPSGDLNDLADAAAAWIAAWYDTSMETSDRRSARDRAMVRLGILHSTDSEVTSLHDHDEKIDELIRAYDDDATRIATEETR